MLICTVVIMWTAITQGKCGFLFPFLLLLLVQSMCWFCVIQSVTVIKPSFFSSCTSSLIPSGHVSRIRALCGFQNLSLQCTAVIYQCAETPEAAGVLGSAGGVHQRWAEEPEEGVPARPGGGEEDPECPSGHWSVPWGRGPEHRHCGINNRSLFYDIFYVFWLTVCWSWMHKLHWRIWDYKL